MKEHGNEESEETWLYDADFTAAVMEEKNGKSANSDVGFESTDGSLTVKKAKIGPEKIKKPI